MRSRTAWSRSFCAAWRHTEVAGRRVALVVAVDEYDDPALTQLASPATDAEHLARVLQAPDLGEFEVEILRNSTSYEIAQSVETLFAERSRDDIVLLHFSCHGIKDEGGELFLAARNTRPALLNATAVDAALVSKLMRKSPAQRVILLLDCCYGGAFERGMTARAAGDVNVGEQFAQPAEAGRGRAVITASSAMEYAFEGTELSEALEIRPSVFTGALVRGLETGEADRDQDGKVALGELYDYVYDEVKRQTPNQTPTKWEYGLHGELVVARNPRRQIRPAPLPSTIVEMLDHSVVASRLGAVAELDHLAGRQDLALAMAACSALERLAAEDDSLRVRTAATEALERTKLIVSPETVDLGVVRVGDEPPRAKVHLEGPPLARTVQVTAPEGVPFELIGDTLSVWLPTAAPMAVDEALQFSGPAGSTIIRVRGAVEAAVRHQAAEPPLPKSKAVSPPAAPEPPNEASIPAGVSASTGSETEVQRAPSDRAKDLLAEPHREKAEREGARLTTGIAATAFVAAIAGLLEFLYAIGTAGFGQASVLSDISSLILGAAGWIAAYGLWKVKPWARILAVGVGIAGIIGSLLTLTTREVGTVILAAPLYVGIVVYLYRPQVRAIFRRV